LRRPRGGVCAAAHGSLEAARVRWLFAVVFIDDAAVEVAPLSLEVSMKQQNKGPVPKPGPTHPSPAVEADRQKQKAEPIEVLGRHKNTGQKDHKGAR
jgi:hypothetical protein